MSRFYQTSQAQPIDWAFQLPYEPMLKSLMASQMQQEKALEGLDKLSAYGNNITPLSKDKAAALEVINELNKGVNSFTNLDLLDPTNKRNLIDFSRKIAQEFSPTGKAGRINTNYKQYYERVKAIDENKNLDLNQKTAYKNALTTGYQGWESDNPFPEINMVDPVNFQKDLTGLFSNFKLSEFGSSNIVQLGVGPEGNAIYGVRSTEQTLDPTNRILAAIQGYMHNPNVQQYIGNGIAYNYLNKDKFIDDDGTFKSPYTIAEKEVTVKENGKDVKKIEKYIVPNFDSAFGQYFNQQLNLLNAEKTKSSLSNISWGRNENGSSNSKDLLFTSAMIQALNSEGQPINISTWSPKALFGESQAVSMQNFRLMGKYTPLDVNKHFKENPISYGSFTLDPKAANEIYQAHAEFVRNPTKLNKAKYRKKLESYDPNIAGFSFLTEASKRMDAVTEAASVINAFTDNESYATGKVNNVSDLIFKDGNWYAVADVLIPKIKSDKVTQIAEISQKYTGKKVVVNIKKDGQEYTQLHGLIQLDPNTQMAANADKVLYGIAPSGERMMAINDAMTAAQQLRQVKINQQGLDQKEPKRQLEQELYEKGYSHEFWLDPENKGIKDAISDPNFDPDTVDDSTPEGAFTKRLIEQYKILHNYGNPSVYEYKW